MCGITGIFAFNSIGRINLVHLEQATGLLEKRGPDSQNTWFDQNVGLGHRRLSVIDPSDLGTQPMQDPAGRFQLIYNGEIYNYLELRNDLIALGHTFESGTDTEVLLAAYIEWKDNCLEKLNGFFAFAIYDTQLGSLFLARDRFGIKPLYYALDEDKLLFASEMKSLMAYGLEQSLDSSSLQMFLQLTYLPAPYTMLVEAKQLEPGHSLLVTQDDFELKKWYQFPNQRPPQKTEYQQAKSKLTSLLEESVADRLVADVPLGAFLSGGLDSSIIVALASRHQSNLQTFSIGFRDAGYFDETKYAKLVADRFQTNHHEFRLSNEDLLDALNSMLDCIDDPFADSSALPSYILSRETRKHVTVALSGDGADELFAGYNKHAAWVRAQNHSWNTDLVTSLSGLWKILPASRNNPVSNLIRKLDRFASMNVLDLQERYWFLASFMTPANSRELISRELHTDNIEFDQRKAVWTSQITNNSLTGMLAVDSQMVLPGDMLTKVDRMSMAHGLEVRVPFLDHRIVEFAFDLPDEFKFSKGIGKRILREAFEELLPTQIFNRPKHGFEVPLLHWFKNELRERLNRDVFDEEKIRSQGIFSWKEISRIKSKLNGFNPGDSASTVWTLLVFQNWYKRYFKQ